MKSLFFSLLLLVSLPILAQVSADVQIKTALLAAPANKRDSAAVYGYSEKKEFVLLRKGLNELVCVADNPDQQGISVSCYHKDLDPFMERGR